VAFGFGRFDAAELGGISTFLLNAEWAAVAGLGLAAGFSQAVCSVGCLRRVIVHILLSSEELAVVLVDFAPVLSLAVRVAVGEEVAPGAPSKVLVLLLVFFHTAAILSVAVVTDLGRRKALLCDESHCNG
jgi:hypothetical protein